MNKILFLIFPAFLVMGCDRNEIETYTVPVEKEQVPAPVVEPAGSVAPAFSADLPEGWTQKPGSGMRLMSYSIAGSSIDFYLTPLAMGDVPNNVNRWRRQVGLPPIAPADIAPENFSVDGHDMKYIEIYNAEDGNGIIAAIMDLAPEYWYFTAKGPVEELQTQAPDIQKFLKSLKVNH